MIDRHEESPDSENQRPKDPVTSDWRYAFYVVCIEFLFLFFFSWGLALLINAVGAFLIFTASSLFQFVYKVPVGVVLAIKGKKDLLRITCYSAAIMILLNGGCWGFLYCVG